MKEIEFLPQWYERKDALSRSRSRRVALVALLIVAMGVWTSRHMGQLQRARSAMIVVEESYSQQDPIIQAALALERERIDLAGKIELHEVLSAGAPMYRLLAEMALVLPASVIIDSLTIEPPAEHPATEGNQMEKMLTSAVQERTGSTIVLSARSLAVSGAGDSVQSLNDSSVFRDARLVKIDPDGETQAYKFTIRCVLPLFRH